jgi:hypothetical protein
MVIMVMVMVTMVTMVAPIVARVVHSSGAKPKRLLKRP